jgi:aminomethyltransferase
MAQPILADTTRKTPLHAEHVRLGARMVPFAGYDMPVQYPKGVLGEHVWTRTQAGLFDVSHMGQAFVVGNNHATTARALEKILPCDLLGLKPGQQRYSMLLNGQGGILDDLMITRLGDPRLDGSFYLVVNAGCKDADFDYIRQHLPPGIMLKTMPEQGLIALQGPQAEAALTRLAPDAAKLSFMTAASAQIAGINVHISRSGYTGEDGFEISVPKEHTLAVWQALLVDPAVEPVGLGARDSLRLEAGLCLYGHDIDTTTNPVEASIGWAIQKRRREEGGFPGAAIIQKAFAEGTARKRVGLLPDGRAPAREGSVITNEAGLEIGRVTSGGFGPSVGGPVAMGYVERSFSAPDTRVNIIVRGEARPAVVAAMPFVPSRYKR